MDFGAGISFDGKIVIVTGGGQGIGEATCLLLAELGASVVIVDVNEEAANQTLQQLPGPGKHLVSKTDVSSNESVGKLYEKIRAEFGRASDCLINNAGILIRNVGLLTTSEKNWDRTLDVNLKSMFLMSRKFLEERLVGAGDGELGGAIVNVSSGWAKIGHPACIEYTSAKAGVLALTKGIAQEFGSRGVRVNTVMPAAVDTAMSPTRYSADAKRKQVNATALKRMAQPIEVARSIAFLASDWASWITGATLEATGGKGM